MARKVPDKFYYTPNEVADIFMVSPITVREWAKKGLLKAKLTPGGHRRFLVAEVEQFARQRGLGLKNSTDVKTRILIVDDDKQFCHFLEELLSDYSDFITTECAYDGFSAGQSMNTFNPNIVLLDLMMPGIDGFEVCSNIKKSTHSKDVRVIAMTGFENKENLERILGAGAETCLPKPIDHNKLLALLNIDGIRESDSGKDSRDTKALGL